MKYWWLSSYLSFFETVTEKELHSKKGRAMLQQFQLDYSYHLMIPSHYLEYYQKVKLVPVEQLSDCGLQLLLAYYIYHGKIVQGLLEKKILDRTIFRILMAMRKVPEAYLPATDYTLLEMITEIKQLKTLVPTIERVKVGNVAACYHCRNIFYTDAIYQQNKKKQCLCPYCNHSTIYFDHDYIPMDDNFLLLAYLYYQKEIAWKKLLPILKKKVSFGTRKDHTFSFVDSENIGTILWEEGHIQIPFVSSKKSLTGKEEDYLATSIYHFLQKCDQNGYKKVSLACDFSQTLEQASIYAITVFTSLLFYFLQHYFSGIEEISLVVPDSVQPIYVNCFKDFYK